MSLSFPPSPSVNQIYTVGTRTWVWDGSNWVVAGTLAIAGPQGDTGPAGPQGDAGPQGATGPAVGSGFASGEYYSFAGIFADAVPTEDRTCYIPFYVDQTTTFDRIAIRTGSSWSAGTVNTRLGIYNNSNGKPSTVVLDAGQVAANAATTTFSITISQSLNAGWYWLAFNAQDDPTGRNFRRLNAIYANYPAVFDTSLNIQNGWIESGVTGAFATAGTVSRSGTVFQIALRAA